MVDRHGKLVWGEEVYVVYIPMFKTTSKTLLGKIFFCH